MTETKTQSPERRAAAAAIHSLRQDLFHDVFDYRPLDPLGTGGPVVRRLPAPFRKVVVWFPHLVVGLVALIALLEGVFAANTYSPFGIATLITAFVPVSTLLMTLVRPSSRSGCRSCRRRWWRSWAAATGPGSRARSPATWVC